MKQSSNETLHQDRWSVLKIPDFRLLIILRICSWMALQTQAVIVGWQVYQLRPDALLLGLIGLTEAIPAIASSFISGHLVDVHRPATIMRASVGVLLLNSIFFLIAISPFVSISTDDRLLILFICVFISGAARSFTSPSAFSLIPKIVPRHLLAPAAAWSTSSFQFATIIGPAIGGLVYGYFGAIYAFAIPTIFQIAAFVGVSSFSQKTKNVLNHGVREPFAKSIFSGLKFAFKQKVLISAMTLDTFSVLFGGAVAMLPIYADQILHVGSTGLGLLRAAPAVGSIIIGVSLAIRPLAVISGTALLWSVVGFGISTLIFAVSTNFYLSLFFLALTGAFDGVSMVIRHTILQLMTPENMRGRVSSVSSVFITSSNEIGSFESGVAARLLGLVPSVVFGGVMTLVVVATTAFCVPELRKTRISGDSPEEPKPA